MRRLTARAAELAGSGFLDSDSVALSFVGEAEIARTNSAFVGHDGPTDVICFDYRQSKEELGDAGDVCADIIVCPEKALKEARKRRVPYSQELALYVVHGLLHAAGEDDLSPAPRRRMRSLERAVVAELKKEFIFSTVFPEP